MEGNDELVFPDKEPEHVLWKLDLGKIMVEGLNNCIIRRRNVENGEVEKVRMLSKGEIEYIRYEEYNKDEIIREAIEASERYGRETDLSVVKGR